MRYYYNSGQMVWKKKKMSKLLPAIIVVSPKHSFSLGVQ